MISDRVGSGTANAAGWDIPESGYPGSAAEAGARTRPRADTFAYPHSEPYAEPDQGTDKRRWQIMAGTGAVAVLVIAILGAWMLGGLSSSNNDTPLSQQLDAIERAYEADGDVSREGVLREILATEDYSGVLGEWSFDDDGDTTLTELSVQTVEDGQFTLDRTLDVSDVTASVE